MNIETDVRKNGKIAILRHSRKCHKCTECGLIIEEGEFYFSVTLAGSGLGSLKYPDHLHIDCLDEHLGIKA